jgi:hypothetical protein
MSWIRDRVIGALRRKQPELPSGDDLERGLRMHLAVTAAEIEEDRLHFMEMARRIATEVHTDAVIAQTPSGLFFHPRFQAELHKPGNERLLELARIMSSGARG